MEQNVVIRKAIINTLQAGGGNVKSVAAAGAYPGACIVCADNSADPLAEYLPPVTKGSCTKAVKIASQAEVRQILTIGRELEVIVASTSYAVYLGNLGTKYMSQAKDRETYRYQSAAILSGNAVTDRTNVYTAIMDKINAYAGNNVEGFLMKSVAFTGGDTALPQVGETITQATSNATAKIASVVVTSGTISGTDAAGTIYLYDVSGTWTSAAKTSTAGTSGFTFDTAALLVIQGLVIVDDANYFPATPGQRKGATGVSLNENFTVANIEVGVSTLAVGTLGHIYGLDAIYSNGIGTRMLTDVPAYTVDGTDTVSGEAGFILNAAPVAGQTYTQFRIFVNTNPAVDVLTEYGFTGGYILEVWADESNGTNLTNFESGLETALGVTIA